MKKNYPLLLIFFLFLSNLFWSQVSGKVVGIKDGDTVVVLLDGNIQKTLRLAEVDCPESSQAFGKNAKQFTSGQIFGKTISFIETDTDRYGRTIAKIYYDNKYLSAEIIKAGYGWWFYQYSNDKSLGELQNLAMNAKLGLWQDPNAISPWEFRKQKREANFTN
ncbi:thermonuclease family protein [Kaistella montana]|uniref:Thermonuclease family protein n=1 Tax=Kaistella montana TaxID=1849733 RepID=A0ABW5KAQ8_9FLAO|nr:thermonuclease family protein [Kaistella montana]MCQ4035059.1 thermonuclease family protein [Kaistella montana]